MRSKYPENDNSHYLRGILPVGGRLKNFPKKSNSLMTLRDLKINFLIFFEAKISFLDSVLHTFLVFCMHMNKPIYYGFTIKNQVGK